MSLRYYYKVQPLLHKEELTTDICIYGATVSGIAAAVQVASSGKKAAIVEFGSHIGGMTSSGLGATDIGSEHAIGALARQFYRDIGAFYGINEGWRFEPKAAAAVLKDWLLNHGIQVYTEHRLQRVEKSGDRLKAIHAENGRSFRAKVFIDATYEGDLMASSGVKYVVGREGNRLYDEHFNGVHFGGPHHNFRRFVDPYKKEGNPSSGLIQGVSALSSGRQGDADGLTQAYNFRLCLSDDPGNMVPFPKPPEYDPERYELLLRYINSGVFDIFTLTVPLPGHKYDHNNWGAVNTDNIGANHDWPDGDYDTRERIFQDHVNYQMGLFWFLANDPRLPAEVRKETSKWGLAADEFRDTGNWPPLLYVREGRRMISDYVLTEHDAFGWRTAEDPVALASYTLDSHNCKRIMHNGRVVNEGNVEALPLAPFPIPYRSIRPTRSECTNLLVPVCISASHSAYGSVRMEPVFMMLGQVAGAAATLAIDETGGFVQDISYSSLEKRLRNEGQILKEPGTTSQINE